MPDREQVRQSPPHRPVVPVEPPALAIFSTPKQAVARCCNSNGPCAVNDFSTTCIGRKHHPIDLEFTSRRGVRLGRRAAVRPEPRRYRVLPPSPKPVVASSQGKPKRRETRARALKTPAPVSPPSRLPTSFLSSGPGPIKLRCSCRALQPRIPGSFQGSPSRG